MSAETHACRYGLNGLNLSLAMVQTGFGPFVAVWLTRQGWSDTEIGIALSIGTASGLIAQLPGGLLVDALRAKWLALLGGLVALGGAALLLAAPATLPTIWAAQILHALASVVITPAIAALTLSICGHDSFGERLGINARYGAIGNAVAGGALGLIAYRLGTEQAVFLTAALLVIPALVSLLVVRRAGVGTAPAATEPVEAGPPFWTIFRIPALHVFAVCTVLFHLANAAMLPLALNDLTQRGGRIDLVVSATIILPQLIVMALAPMTGALTRGWGRRPVLCLGFGALPLRALLFATEPSPTFLVLWQALDGVSATVFGLMMPLIAADLTRGTRHMNVAIGSVGLAAGLGATLSTTFAGLVADRLGTAYAFYGLAATGALALLIILFAMPETRPAEEASRLSAPSVA